MDSNSFHPNVKLFLSSSQSIRVVHNKCPLYFHCHNSESQTVNIFIDQVLCSHFKTPHDHGELKHLNASQMILSLVVLTTDECKVEEVGLKEICAGSTLRK